MRLDDINAFLEAKAVYDRAHFRAFGRRTDHTIYLSSIGEFTEAARACDCSIKKTELPSGDSMFEFYYGGTLFAFFGADGEGDAA